MADGEEPLEGQGHRAVDASHQTDLCDRDDVRKRPDPDEMIVA